METKIMSFKTWVMERYEKEKRVEEFDQYKNDIRERLSTRLEVVTWYYHDRRLATSCDRRTNINFFNEDLAALFFDERAKYEANKAALRQEYEECINEIEECNAQLNVIKGSNVKHPDVKKIEQLQDKIDRENIKKDKLIKGYKKTEEAYNEVPAGCQNAFKELTPEMVELFNLLLEPELDKFFRSHKRDWRTVDIGKRRIIVDLVEEIYSSSCWSGYISATRKRRLAILYPDLSDLVEIEDWFEEYGEENIQGLPNDEEEKIKVSQINALKKSIIEGKKELSTKLKELVKIIADYREEIEKSFPTLSDAELEEKMKKEIELAMQQEKACGEKLL